MSCPIVLLKVDKDLGVDLYHTVLPFGLAIGLRVKGGRESLFDAKKIAKQGSEL